MWPNIIGCLGSSEAVGGLGHLDARGTKVDEVASGIRDQCLQATGPTKGGRTIKGSAGVAGAGGALRITLTDEQRVDVKTAEAIRTLAGNLWVADWGYDNDFLRARDSSEGANTAICSKCTRRSKVPLNQGYVRSRHRVESLFRRINGFLAICTGYDKSHVHFIGGLHLAAVIDWWRFRVGRRAFESG